MYRYYNTCFLKHSECITLLNYWLLIIRTLLGCKLHVGRKRRVVGRGRQILVDTDLIFFRVCFKSIKKSRYFQGPFSLKKYPQCQFICICKLLHLKPNVQINWNIFSCRSGQQGQPNLFSSFFLFLSQCLHYVYKWLLLLMINACLEYNAISF